ncbi:MAG: ABC transporter transmembrane domain-containing protein, partial [Oscillospiraceae bacterium]|nr:ABC transporter transmembrane domain-containing protein [Oscillospiraceae bacterium]
MSEPNRFEDDIYSKPFSLKVWAGMLRFFKQYKRPLLWLAIVMVFCAVFDVAIPLYQKYIIDSFIVPRTTQGLIPVIIIGLVFIGISGTVLTIIVTRIALYIEMSFARDIRKALFDHLQKLSISYYNTTPVGYMIARVMSDTNRIGELIAWGLLNIAWGAAYIIFAIISMLMLDPRMGAILVAMIPFMALVTMWFQSRILKYNRVVRRTNSRITGSFNEGINGARTSKTLVIEDINSREFGNLAGEMYSSSVRAASLSAVFQPCIMMFGAISVALILTFGGGYTLEGTMPLGTLSALISYAIGIFEPIRHVTRTFADIVATQANIERVEGLLETEPMITDAPEVVKTYGDSFDPKPENWEPIHGNIRFDDVTF